MNSCSLVPPSDEILSLKERFETFSLGDEDEKTKLRYYQIHSLLLIDSFLSEKKILEVARSIEQKIKPVDGVSAGYYKKEMYFSSRTIAYDSEQKNFYICLKTHYENAFCMKGRCKRVTIAILVPDNVLLPCSYAAQNANYTKDINKYTLIQSEGNTKYKDRLKEVNDVYKNMLHELAIYKRFTGNKGIWPLLSALTYVKMLPNNDEIPKVTFFTPLAYGDLFDVYTGKIELTMHELLDLTDCLASGIHYLHSAGCLYGDLKPDNVLLRFEEEKVVTGLNDFGNYYLPGKDSMPTYWTQGYYEVIQATAPELFGNRYFDCTRDDPYKVEMWALGCLLYSVFYRQKPDWYPAMKKAWDEKGSAYESEQAVELMKKAIQFGKKKQVLEKKKSRSLEEDLELLLYSMLCLSSQRADSGMIVQRITDIKNRNT